MGLLIKVGNRQVDFFTKGSIELKYAHIGSTFKLSGVFDKDNAFQRRLFKPLSYEEITIFSVRGERLITGVVLNHAFKSEPREEIVTIFGYSKTGVLQDSQIPLSVYPLEYNGLTLRQIATKLCDPFGIKVIVENDQGISDEVIDEVTADPEQTVSKFIVQIASQRNLVITHNEFGNLLITRAQTNVPSIATYREEVPATTIRLSVVGANMHSEITAMKEIGIESDNASESEVTNTLVQSFRPKIRLQNVGNDNTVDNVARNIRANELKSIRLIISSDRWEWLNDKSLETIRPNNIVDVISADNYLAKRTQFFVESVQLDFDSTKETSILNCVLPQVYNNEDPKDIFQL